MRARIERHFFSLRIWIDDGFRKHMNELPGRNNCKIMSPELHRHRHGWSQI